MVPQIRSRSEHNISRTQISDSALKVLYRLKKSGFEAYLVGGCVRDLLLGREPKDFDVVTDATPEQIRDTFRNCRLIGRRFRLAHIHFGREIIEVATFRGTSQDGASDGASNDRVMQNGRLLRDNIFGTIEEDVLRRDFTVNALYYNIRDFSVIDYVEGLKDHEKGLLRLIGDPEERYREDPVRMLRAVRFATKLGFSIHPDCEEPIPRLAMLLTEISSARLYDEVLKLLLSGYSLQAFEYLRHYHLFDAIFPETEKLLKVESEGFPLTFLAKALENTDSRLAEGKPVTPYFLFSALLWEPVRLAAARRKDKGIPEVLALQQAAGEVISKQVKRTAFPKRVSIPMREVWDLQARLNITKGVRPFRLLGHPRFRAAYDFLLLRAETGEAEPALAEWWTRFQEASEKERKTMTKSMGKRRRKGSVKSTRTRKPKAE
ncbi:MAG: polynucleotide adenylyltransferase PcnB [Methylococcales bacterium]